LITRWTSKFIPVSNMITAMARDAMRSAKDLNAAGLKICAMIECGHNILATGPKNHGNEHGVKRVPINKNLRDDDSDVS